MKKKSSSTIAALMLLLFLWLILFPAALACQPTGRGRCSATPPPPKGCNVSPPSPNGRKCRTCIVNQMKFGCPPCAPALRCMARCLWEGNSRMNCIKRCDCGGNPKLSDCKKCMSRCKCSCLLSSS